TLQQLCRWHALKQLNDVLSSSLGFYLHQGFGKGYPGIMIALLVLNSVDQNGHRVAGIRTDPSQPLSTHNSDHLFRALESSDQQALRIRRKCTKLLQPENCQTPHLGIIVLKRRNPCLNFFISQSNGAKRLGGRLSYATVAILERRGKRRH